jgi:hypothetical protein
MTLLVHARYLYLAALLVIVLALAYRGRWGA